MENYHTYIPYHLILGEIEHNLSTAEAEELEQWKNSSSENQFIYNSLRNADEQLDLLRLYQKTDSVAAWNKNKDKLLAPRRNNKIYIWAATIAATILVAISVIGLNRHSSAVYETALNETRLIVLPDSSSILLNQQSSVSFSKSGFDQNRHIKLIKGEAFFTVKHDEAKEFSVELGDIVVRDIGTTFDLKMDADSIQAIVSSGSVSMEYSRPGILRGGDTRKLVLEANQMGVFDRKTRTITTTDALPVDYNAWQSKKIRYNQTPLSIVVTDLKRLYGTEVILADSSLKEKKLTALFTNKSGEQVLQIIAASLQLKLEVVKKDSIFMLSQ